MTSQAAREILWNVNTLPNVAGMYALFAVSVIICAIGLIRHAELIANGKPAQLTTRSFLQRIETMVEWVLLQRGVMRSRTAAWAHALVFFGFIVLLFTTTMVFLDHDLGLPIYRGEFYLGVTLLSDVFGLGVIVGCAIFAHRRLLLRPDYLHSTKSDYYFLAFICLLCVQGFLLEGLRIHATADKWALFSPVGLAVSRFFWPLSFEASKNLHFALWWFHTVSVFVGIALIPYSKLFHIVASSLNLYFMDLRRARGALPFPGDIAKQLESGKDFSIGLGSIKDYSWKHMLDLEACTSCGRCQDSCPAYNSGKPLSPKWLILDSREHALKLHQSNRLGESIFPPAMVTVDKLFNGRPQVTPEQRAGNPMVQSAALKIGANADDLMAGEVLDRDVFWSCTTCFACVEACPVGINHVDQIIENRRHMALMRGEIPSEAQATLRKLENQQNPFGDRNERSVWLAGLDVPQLKAGDRVDYLYWVGCVSAYDPRKQKIAKSLVRLMKHAKLSFGVLGNAEGCSGDPARRLGEENLFQSLAKSNLEILRSITFKTIVANCPHCFNTLKNEYPQLGNLQDGAEPEIIHHSVLLKRLLAEGRIELKEGSDGTITFHDPCYLGRYNGEYDAPRSALKAVKGLKIIEMEKSRESGMCCGAGGGHFWMDLKIGQRVNVLRTEQAAATNSNEIATACPFCLQMMEDGVKLTNREGSMAVRDLAEILAERLI